MHSLSTRKQVDYKVTFWRDGRVVDYNGLENRRTERYRGFESLSLRNCIKRKSLSYNNLGIFYCPCRTSWPTFWPKFDPVLDPLLTHFWPTFFSEKLILRWNDFFMSRYFTSFLYTENHYIIGFLLLADLNLCYQSLSYHWFLTRIYSLLYSPCMLFILFLNLSPN